MDTPPDRKSVLRVGQSFWTEHLVGFEVSLRLQRTAGWSPFWTSLLYRSGHRCHGFASLGFCAVTASQFWLETRVLKFWGVKESQPAWLVGPIRHQPNVWLKGLGSRMAGAIEAVAKELSCGSGTEDETNSESRYSTRCIQESVLSRLRCNPVKHTVMSKSLRPVYCNEQFY